jgi:hypothetical protein
MCRILAIALTFVFMRILASHAQEPVREFPKAVFGIKGGVNVSRFSTSINSESRAKAGLALGIYVKKQIDPKIFFRWELYYSNQGQKDNYLYPYGGPSIGRTTTSMHYVNTPFLLEFGRNVSFQTGAQVGLLIVGKEKGTIESVKVNNNLKDVMTTADMSLVIGVGISPGEHFNGGIRINYGVTNIYNPETDSSSGVDVPEIHNRTLHCYVAYSF